LSTYRKSPWISLSKENKKKVLARLEKEKAALVETEKGGN